MISPLVKRVRIRYFRSLYDITLKDCQGVNVISGSNDVGKSNILRALNLFFNGSCDWSAPINFSSDFSIRRRQDIYNSIKGKQFVSVDIEFRRPTNYSGSLPPTFWVTRKWYKEGMQQKDDLDAREKNKQLKSASKSRRMLSQFINRIHYEYVPAVKDRYYYLHLLTRLQSTLLDSPIRPSEAMGQLTSQLASDIRAQLEDLTDEFYKATGVTTDVAPPASLSELFRAFEFSAQAGESLIPLTNKGDGIQARYVSSVLHYIASNNKDFFIWGFEEPENSLEYSHAMTLAEAIVDRYSQDAQIFLTTHSPAFLAARKREQVCAYRVYYKDGDTQVANVDAPGSDSHDVALRHELGIFRLQEEMSEEFAERLKKAERDRGQLETIISDLELAQAPVLIVEGKLDREILEIAWYKLYGERERDFSIWESDTTEGQGGGARRVRDILEAAHPSDPRVAVGLFDNDKEGADAFKRLSNIFQRGIDGEVEYKVNRNGRAGAVLLPVPPGREELAKAGLLTIEGMFDDNDLGKRDEKGRGLEFEYASVPRVRVGDILLEADVVGVAQDLLPDDLSARFWKIRGGKKEFAENVVPTFEEKSFRHFKVLFENLDRVLSRADYARRGDAAGGRG